MKSFKSNYANTLYGLAEKKMITEDQLSNFLQRGVQVISPKLDFGLEHLARILPEIIIGASKDYINRMKIPYQSTSFVSANARVDGKGLYIYKLPAESSGGIISLFGGKRKIGDSTFAAVHRILLGYKAILVSAVNLIINKNKIWNWQFFGNHFKDSDPALYNDLIELENRWTNKMKVSSGPCHYIVVARSESTFKRLNIIEEYKRNRIDVLNPKNEISVVFLTNQDGYDYAVKHIPESDLVNYVITGRHFDIQGGLLSLRKNYNVNILLNDGGRQMSNSFRDAGFLAEERITIEPYPGENIIPEEIDPTSILGEDGIGLDGGEMKGTIRVQSIKIGSEQANVYLYPLDNAKILN
jgi:hypothetical protein